MTIYLDFDGTVVEHQYPSIGNFNEGCIEVIKKLYIAEHKIILNTYRANCQNGTLEEAINYLRTKELWRYISQNQAIKIDPTPWNWKSHFQKKCIFLDDICKGIPTKPTDTALYEIVDWAKIHKELEANGLYD